MTTKRNYYECREPLFGNVKNVSLFVSKEIFIMNFKTRTKQKIYLKYPMLISFP